MKIDRTILAGLGPALQWLEERIQIAVEDALKRFGSEVVTDPFLGLRITHEEIVRLLAQRPLDPFVHPQAEEAPKPEEPSGSEPKAEREEKNHFPGVFGRIWRTRTKRDTISPEGNIPEDKPPVQNTNKGLKTAEQPDHITTKNYLPGSAVEGTFLGWVGKTYHLSPFDLATIIVCLAPELDRRYEKIYAFLQNDVTRRRPSVDLALNLICNDAQELLIQRKRFSPDAPLRQNGLIHLIPDRHDDHAPLLSHFVKLDDQIINCLLGQRTLDPRLAPFCKYLQPAGLLSRCVLEDETLNTLSSFVEDAWDVSHPLRLYFQGPGGVGKQEAAMKMAADIGVSVLLVDLPQAQLIDRNLEWAPRLIFREALFQNVMLYLQGFDILFGDEHSIPFQQMWETMTSDVGVTVMAGEQTWVPLGREPGGALIVPFPIPDFAARRDFWRASLATVGVSLALSELEALVSRFRLTPAQIEDAVMTAYNEARLQASHRNGLHTEEIKVTLEELFDAARAQTGHDLANLARKIEPLYRWKDIILPEDSLDQLSEICQRVGHRHKVLMEWGFEGKLSYGRGITALFAGPSGTGKTMAAEIIAADLGLDLYKIDISSVVSKYIGETEKNLDRIFTAAENANAILFFDEADALFGKRSEVRDSHDRYANIEISYLLQKMEEYDGIAILATNLRQNLDDGFVRRLAFTVQFPFPDEASRRKIWQGIWPQDLPREVPPDDLAYMGAQFRLSGGNIKNIALAAAFLAAEADAPVNTNHLLQATRREYQKLGKELAESELIAPVGELLT